MSSPPPVLSYPDPLARAGVSLATVDGGLVVHFHRRDRFTNLWQVGTAIASGLIAVGLLTVARPGRGSPFGWVIPVCVAYGVIMGVVVARGRNVRLTIAGGRFRVDGHPMASPQHSWGVLDVRGFSRIPANRGIYVRLASGWSFDLNLRHPREVLEAVVAALNEALQAEQARLAAADAAAGTPS